MFLCFYATICNLLEWLYPKGLTVYLFSTFLVTFMSNFLMCGLYLDFYSLDRNNNLTTGLSLNYHNYIYTFLTYLYAYISEYEQGSMYHGNILSPLLLTMNAIMQCYQLLSSFLDFPQWCTITWNFIPSFPSSIMLFWSGYFIATTKTKLRYPTLVSKINYQRRNHKGNMKCVQMELYHMKTIMVVSELLWNRAPSFFFYLDSIDPK